jgi:hypothetical protein
MNKPQVDLPVNANERYLYAMVIRLDALCNMMSSLIEHIAEKEQVATTNEKQVEQPIEQPVQKETAKRTQRKKAVKKSE